MPDIKPTHVEVVGVHPRHTRLLVVDVTVEPEPPKRWMEAFNSFVGGKGEDTGFQPQLEGKSIRILPPDSALETWVAAVERRIRHVNKKFADELKTMTPQPQRATRISQAVAQEGFSAEVRERILAARMAAERMSGVFQSSVWETVDVTSLDRQPTKDTVLDMMPPAMMITGKTPLPAPPPVDR